MKTKHVAPPRAENHSERQAPIPGFKPMKPRQYGDVKTVVSAAINQAGGIPQAAALLQRDYKTVYGYADPRDKANMSLDMARMLTFFGQATAFAEDFAALAGGSFVPSDCRDEKSIGEYTVLANRDVTRLVGLLVAALEDGSIDDGERAALLPVVDELHRDVTNLRNRLRSQDRAAKGGRNA